MSDIHDTIKEQVSHNRVVLYMKGTPQFPQCGFSATVAEILKRCGVTEYASFNVLQDDALRQGIKEYLELADDAAALRRRRIRRRLRHRARDVPDRRAAAAAGASSRPDALPRLRARALDAPHVRDAAQRAHHVREVTAVAHLHAEEHRDDLAAVGPLHRHGVDVRVGVADRRRELGEQAAPVGDQHAARPQSNTPCTSGAHSTSTSCVAVEALLAQRHAIARVHDQSLALAELADDRVARDRPAALRVLDRDAFDAAQRQRAGLPPVAAACAASSSGLAGGRVSACATTNDSRLPRPMSARISSWRLRAVLLARALPSAPR